MTGMRSVAISFTSNTALIYQFVKVQFTVTERRRSQRNEDASGRSQ